MSNRPGKHYAYASNNPVQRTDPMGEEDLYVRGKSAYWVNENQGYFADSDVREIYVGMVSGSNIELSAEFGGGSIPLDTLSNIAKSHVYMGSFSESSARAGIRSALDGSGFVPRGGSLLGAVASGAGTSLLESGEAMINLPATGERIGVRLEGVYALHKEGGSSAGGAIFETTMQGLADVTGGTAIYEAASGVDTNRVVTKRDATPTLTGMERVQRGISGTTAVAGTALMVDAVAPASLSGRAGTSTRGVGPIKGRIPSVKPANLSQQLALEEAKGAGTIILRNLGDAPRLVSNYGRGTWVKMHHVHKIPGGGIYVIHWFRNLKNMMDVEFKFKVD